jgi:hypothetical protein
LARYIGVMATPENEQKQPMAMTAPVLMNNEQSTDGSSCPKAEYMAFVLPSKYSMENNPPPKVPIASQPGT